MPPDVMQTGVVLVGPGRAGRAFARSWTGSGGSIVLVGRQVAATKAFALTIPRAEAVALDDRLPLASDVLILAVPDDVIGSLARRLSPRVACRFALHFSGALPSSELAPLSSGGTKLASMHPLRAFSGSETDDWSGAFVAIEGEESAAKTATRLCRHVGARPHPLAAANKPLYHAAATLAAGGSGSLLSFATRLWTRAGLSEEEGRAALAGLAAGAVDAVGRLPFDRALTGPVARRDVETVRVHRDALARLPDVSALYALLARETLRRTPGRGREDEIAAILEVLEATPGDSPRATDEFPDKSGRKG
jgi:predicted short-subunit dehydrogenase-like oxidoreductase (DUF2520 family)